MLRRVHLDRAARARSSSTALDGVLAVHSLSKRSNLAGVRVGFYAGDPELVHFLAETRKHAGFMVAGPVQAAAVAAWADDAHVEAQRQRYRHRLERMAEVLGRWGLDASSCPTGGFYLWVAAPDGDEWALTERLAAEGGVVVSPGEFYGAGGGRPRPAGHGAARTTTSSWWPGRLGVD